MKKVLLSVLFSAASIATPVWAQNVPPATAAPAAVPAQPAPARAPAPPAPATPVTVAPRAVAPAQPAPLARPATAPPAAQPASPARPAPAAAPDTRNYPNVRFDVTITDAGGAKPVTKSISLTVGSFGNNASIRNVATVPNTSGVPGPQQIPIPLNVDIRGVTWIDNNNAVRANVTVEYQPYVPEAKSQPGTIQASAQTIFQDGRRTQILVASDPVSDRKTTIEVMATIIK